MTEPPPPHSGDVDLRRVLDRMEDGFFAVDADWQITYANETAVEFLRTAMGNETAGSATIRGRHLWESIPDAVDTVFYDYYHEALETQETVEFQANYQPLATWFDVRVFPSESGLSIYVRDITEQRLLKQRRQDSLRALQELYAVSSDTDRSFDQKVEAMLELGCEYLDLPNGFLTSIEQDTQHIELSVATHPSLQPGESCPLDEAYCQRTIELDRLLTVVNAADEGWVDDPAYDRFRLGTYIGGRVEVNGELYGTLCFADTATRDEAFTDTTRTFVELLTRWVSYELERQVAQTELQQERDRLDEFTSVVSHDLRNPLNTAIGRLDMLAAETDSEQIPPIRRSLDRMVTLIDDLLALARDDDSERTTVDLGELVADAWATTTTADATLAVGFDSFWISGDQSRLRQLFENLFRNAVEHGGNDVTVSVEATEDGFAVADDGPGIPVDDHAQLFESGYTTQRNGTGLGLRIVAKVVADHGWEITARDAEGARFEITGVQRAEPAG